MKYFLFCMAVCPFLLMLMLSMAAAALLFGVAFICWDLSLIVDACRSFAHNFSWVKFRAAWVVGLIVGLIVSFIFSAYREDN